MLILNCKQNNNNDQNNNDQKQSNYLERYTELLKLSKEKQTLVQAALKAHQEKITQLITSRTKCQNDLKNNPQTSQNLTKIITYYDQAIENLNLAITSLNQLTGVFGLCDERFAEIQKHLDQNTEKSQEAIEADLNFITTIVKPIFGLLYTAQYNYVSSSHAYGMAITMVLRNYSSLDLEFVALGNLWQAAGDVGHELLKCFLTDSSSSEEIDVLQKKAEALCTEADATETKLMIAYMVKRCDIGLDVAKEIKKLNTITLEELQKLITTKSAEMAQYKGALNVKPIKKGKTTPKPAANINHKQIIVYYEQIIKMTQLAMEVLQIISNMSDESMKAYGQAQTLLTSTDTKSHSDAEEIIENQEEKTDTVVANYFSVKHLYTQATEHYEKAIILILKNNMAMAKEFQGLSELCEQIAAKRRQVLEYLRTFDPALQQEAKQSLSEAQQLTKLLQNKTEALMVEYNKIIK